MKAVEGKVLSVSSFSSIRLEENFHLVPNFFPSRWKNISFPIQQNFPPDGKNTATLISVYWCFIETSNSLLTTDCD